MPDISKITTLDGTTYDIKDAVARSQGITHPLILESGVDYFSSTSALPDSPAEGRLAFVESTPIDILNLVYPIGSIYLSVNSASPATLFGGTWEQIEDRFLLAAGTTYAAGATGGSATIAHTHSLGSDGYAKLTAWSTDNGIVTYKENSGVTSWTSNYRFQSSSTPGGYQKESTYGVELGGKTGAASNTNNMPPYLTVYMWKRTA